MLANPWVLLAVALTLVATHGAVGWKSYHVGQDALIAQQKREDDIERRTRQAAMEGAADAISKIEVKHVTIRQRAETVIRKEPVYTNCSNSPDGLRLINQALTPGAQPPGEGVVPGSGSAD